MPRLAALLLILTPLTATAQVSDAFTDGDFTADPAWTGTTDRWTVAPLDGDPALRTDGRPEADTLFLATPSAVNRGAWSFVFAYRGVNLSAFNGARVFLMASADTLAGGVHGYFLQLGANNSDEIRLYRQDGDPSVSSNRILLGRSDARLGGTEGTLTLRVTRTEAGAWMVQADDEPLFEATDATYTTSRSFGFWVKHTASGAAGLFFDDVAVEGATDPPDVTAPEPLAAIYDPEEAALAVTFSESLDPATVSPAAFRIDAAILPRSASLASDRSTVRLRLADALPPGAHMLTIDGVADPVGNRVLGAVLEFEVPPVGPAAGSGEVVINEILYAPPGDGGEFVELFNRTTHAFDLRRFALSDSRRRPVAVTDSARSVPPGGYVVLAEDSAAFAAAFPGVEAFVPSSWPTLNDGGDTAMLWFDEAVLDSVPYRPGWGGAGVSLERFDPAGPSDSRFNFGETQSGAGGTPGAQNTRFAPDRTPPTILFAEQAHPLEVDLFLDEPIETDGLHPSFFTLNDGRPPERVTVLNAEATALRLRFADGPTGSDLTVRALTDLTGNYLDGATLPLAYLPARGELILNEVLYEPRADPFDGRPDQPEYLELLNTGGRTLTLRNLFTTGRTDEHGTADTLHLGDALLATPPGGFSVVFAELPDTPPGASALAQAFPEVDRGNGRTVLLAISRASLGLSNGGDVVRLHRADGLVLDSLAYAPGWHHPALRETAGTALERRDPASPNRAPNWTSSLAPAGGTPGRPNSVALPAAGPTPDAGLHIEPSPFSPDRDGVEDVAVLTYTLAEDGGLVRARIFDQRGRPVRTLTDALLAGRTGRLLWDGLDDAGHPLRLGVYVVLFEAFDARGGTLFVAKEPIVLARRLD